MTYTLHRLAAGSYDLLLLGNVVGGVNRNISAKGGLRGWRPELINNLPPRQRSEPFTEAEHIFRTFSAAWTWLGDPEVTNDISDV